MPVTLLLLAVNVGVFVAMVAGGVSLLEPSPLDLIAWGGLFGPLTIGHQWWRVVTSAFLHIGLIHLALNMVCLRALGPAAERQFGSTSYLAGYLLAGIGGAALSLLVHGDQVGAGASGAIFGVAGRLLPHEWILQRRGIDSDALLSRRDLVGFLGTNLVFGFVYPGVDAAAHVGGLLVGLVSGALPALMAESERGWRRWTGLGAASALVGAALFVLAGRRTLPAAEYAGVKREVLEARQSQHRVRDLRNVAERRPDSVEAYLELAKVEFRLGDSDEAVRALTKGLERVPDSYILLAALGSLYLKLGRHDLSVDTYERLARRYPDSADVPYNLAIAHARRAGARSAKGDTVQAAEDWRRVLALTVDTTLKRTAREQLSLLRADAPATR
jgi:rhomboid protease GluP